MTSPLLARYDGLWNDSAPEVRAGRATLDSLPLRKAEDGRRGITLLTRPSIDVAARLSTCLETLCEIEPEQYVQPRSDLHLTVLSLFTATEVFAPYIEHLPLYREAISEALQDVSAFELEVRGLTLSRGAVLAQGFPLDDTLAALRDRLREAPTRRGLGDSLDGRYRLETAHLTVFRFVRPLRDPERFVEAVEAVRTEPFGTIRVERLELVLGDWYQSAEHERPLASYPLPPRTE